MVENIQLNLRSVWQRPGKLYSKYLRGIKKTTVGDINYRHSLAKWKISIIEFVSSLFKLMPRSCRLVKYGNEMFLRQAQ